MRVAACFVLLIVAARVGFAREAEEAADEDRLTLAEVEAGIGEALLDAGAPGAAAAMVRDGGIFWAAGFGVADRTTGRRVTPDTPFRLGSVSKSLVSLAVLQLVEEGRLALDDRLRDLAPELDYENRWEETHPVRLAHLLEHTTGWDDIHLSEYAHTDPWPITLAHALALYPSSRSSRWPPGTHASYCNAGPAVAAFIVEKESGLSFDDYVRQRILDPLRMPAATYLPAIGMGTEPATGYLDDGATPVDYWHIVYRPSGALDAPVTELAQLVRLLLGRGAVDGVRLLSPESVERMETPTTSAAARAGVELGYALGNYNYVVDGFVLQGHGGGVNGGIAEYAYLPGGDVGYAVALNSIQGETFRRVREILRDYLLHDLSPPEPEPEVELSSTAIERLAGYYEPVVARQEITRFLVRWATLRLRADGGRLTASGWFGPSHELTHVGGDRFLVDEVPRASVVFLEDGLLEGTAGPVRGTYARTPALLYWLQVAVALLVVGLMASSVCFALVWLPRRLFHRLEGVPLAGRAVPLAAVLTLALAAALVAVDTNRFIWRFGQPTPWAISLWLLIWAFAVLSIAGVWIAWRAPAGIWVRRHSLLVAAANLTMTLYLAWWGIVGWRSWV